MDSCETLVTDAEREEMGSSIQGAPWVAPGFNGFDIDIAYQMKRLIDEAKGRKFTPMLCVY